MYKSDIRDTTITALLEKAGRRNYGQFLSKINIIKLRGIQNETISFDFPVTAVIATNGGGKTTILGAAAIAYKDISPKKYFARGGRTLIRVTSYGELQILSEQNGIGTLSVEPFWILVFQGLYHQLKKKILML